MKEFIITKFKLLIYYGGLRKNLSPGHGLFISGLKLYIANLSVLKSISSATGVTRDKVTQNDFCNVFLWRFSQILHYFVVCRRMWTVIVGVYPVVYLIS